MKKLIYAFLLIIVVCSITNLAQSRNRSSRRKTSKAASVSSQKGNYYISVARANAAQYSKNRWAQVAATFKRNGVPAFFAAHRSLPLDKQTRGKWLLVRITKRLKSAAADALLLGPFDSQAAARAAVNKFPELFSDEGSPFSENYAGEWSMGFYLILGVRTQ